MKKCPNCKEKKSLEEFSRDKYKKDGRCSRCKECLKGKVDKSKLESYSRERYLKNKERVSLLQRERNKYNPKARKDTAQKARLRYYYDISLEEYNNLLKGQEGCCAVCGVHQSKLKRALYVDHDHSTGRVRGLLCHQCNVGIGMLRDDKNLLLKAAEYLIK